jgi:hypothetical protein
VTSAASVQLPGAQRRRSRAGAPRAGRAPFLPPSSHPMHAPLRIASVAAALALAACGGGGDGGAGFATRDSAGIRIAESTAPAWKEGEGWTVAAEPSLDLGGEEAPADQQFGGVTDAVRLSDGTVVVADGQAQELRWFGPDGALKARAGREGEGPGEFTGIHRLARLAGDSIGAWDLRQSRLTLFDAAGTMAAQHTLRPLPGTLSDLVGVLADGSVILFPGFKLNFSSGERATRDTLPYLRTPRDGSAADTIATYPGDETVTLTAGEGERRMALRSQVPWGAATHRAVRGDALYVGESGRGEVAVHGPDGAVRTLLRRPFTPVEVTEADRDAYRKRQMETDAPAEMAAVLRELAGKVPFPARKSAFAGMLVDAEGCVWLEEHTDGDAPDAYQVFGADGRLLGRVTMPAGLRAREIGRDYVLGTWNDELDVTHVRVHPLRRTP